MGKHIIAWLYGWLFKAKMGWAQAQGDQQLERNIDNQSIPMADLMRESGKIYVVVAVILLIFIGIVIYLFRIEKTAKALKDEIAALKDS